jgi:putative Holliday junction resolvase
MKYLGIDFGQKRVGIAISNEEGKMAFPKDTFLNDNNLLENIVILCTRENISEIVMGHSINFKGEENKIMGEVNQFKKLLEDRKYLVHLEPEYMTTQQAKRIQGKSGKTDASAATIILQSYLDRINVR